MAPLVRALGYEVSGPHRVVRGRRLEHPFVALGVSTHKVSIVPDYLLFVVDRPTWVLDAKAPSESIDDPDHHAQAYSYAIHRDVRVDWYALCNGREFGLYNVADMAPKPRLRFFLSELRDRWAEVHTFLRPSGRIADRGRIDKDFGILLLRVGTHKDMKLHFLDVPLLDPSIGRLEGGPYRLARGVGIEGQRYHVSYDFDDETFASFLTLLGKQDALNIERALRVGPTAVHVTGDLGSVHLECRLGELEENDLEHFIPLKVVSVTR